MAFHLKPYCFKKKHLNIFDEALHYRDFMSKQWTEEITDLLPELERLQFYSKYLRKATKTAYTESVT